MKKISTWLSNLSLKKKIIIYSYAVIIPVLLVICSFMFVVSYDSAQSANIDTNFHNLQSLSDNTEAVMKEVEDLSTYIAINQDINQILTSKSIEKLNKDHQLWNHQSPIQMVQDMMALKGYINTVAIYPENGVKPYLRCTDSSSFMTELSFLKGSKIYKDSVKKRGKVLWCKIEKGGQELYLASRADKLVLCREIFNSTKSQKLGFLVIGIPLNRLDGYYESELESDMANGSSSKNQDTGIIVLNKDYEKLFGYGTVNEKVEKHLEKNQNIKLEGTVTDKMWTYGGYNIYVHKGVESNITICKVSKRLSFGQVARNIVYIPVFVMLAVLLGLLPVLWFVSIIVTKPLGEVCNAMGKFQTGDFEQRLEVNTTDEVGQVADCFNLMVKEIEELINKNYVSALKERESELALLQAQINPHFLYNTLDSLYWQACNSGNEDIAENIYALSQFFRLVLGEGKSKVLVSAELELVQRYLDIQKMRFVKKINYEIEVEDEILDAIVPKLILQPFIENCVVHGVQNSTKACDILIKGKRKEDYIEFSIRDTGIGMSREKLEDIRNSIAEKINSENNHYAIKNVKERLELTYGSEYKLSIDSAPDKGTEVNIVIPFRKGENKCH